MAAPDQPIGAAERDHLLRDVRLPVAVAVSGGADSTALMHLVAGWAGARGRAASVPPGMPPVLVVTVDHGLRAESAEEAAWVGRRAQQLGLAHTTLRWTGPKPRTGIQEAARAARYSLMCEHIASEPLARPRQILLAHHLDDQAETVLMRLARGSGVDGLSGMRPVEPRIWLRLSYPVEERAIELVRPLLSVPRRRLEATLRAAGGGWLEDPSNADVRYERVRLRAAVRERQALGLGTESLALTAHRLASARSALEAAQHKLARAAVDLNDGAWASIDSAVLAGAPEELAVRLLRTVIGAFGGQAKLPGRSQVEDLVQRLRGSGPAALARGGMTLGGAVIEPGGGRKAARGHAARVVAVYREPGRRPLPKAELGPGQGVFWDRRFYFSLAPESRDPVRLEALGQTGFARLKRAYPNLRQLPLPATAAAALPAVWTGNRLLTVACLSAAEPALLGPAGPDGRPLLQVRFAAQHVRAILGEPGDDDI